MRIDMSNPGRGAAPDWLSLERSETVQVRAAPSKNLVLAGLAGGMGLIVAVSVVVAALGDITTGRILSFAVLVAVLALLAAIYLVVNRWEYAVTSDRVSAVRGLWSPTIRSVALADVQSVTLDQSGWQQLVHVGDLVFVTNDDELRFWAVENPGKVYEQVLTHVA